MQIPIAIDIYGETIRGIFHIPIRPLKDKIRIYAMCYGYNGDMCEVNRITRRMGVFCEKNGVYFLRIDYRGHGISDGSSCDITMERKVEDIEAALQFARGCIGINNCNLNLIGFSDGAKIALEVAKRVEIEKLFLWNPILNMVSISNLYNAQHGKNKKMYKDLNTGKHLINLFGIGISVSYLNEIMKIDMETALFNANQSIKCIWGEKDLYTKQLREKCIASQNSYIQNEIIKGAKHLFGEEGQQNQLFALTLDEE